MIKKVFTGTERSDTEFVDMQCYGNRFNEIFISLVDTSTESYNEVQFVCLDLATAKALRDELITEINEMEAGHNE